MRWMGSESAPSPARLRASTSSRNGNSGVVPVQRENGETQVKQMKDVPLFDGTKAKFPAWKQNFLCLGKLHGLLGFSLLDSMSLLPTKRCPSLPYRRPFLARMYKSVSLPGTFSHGLSAEIVIPYATLSRQPRDGVR